MLLGWGRGSPTAPPPALPPRHPANAEVLSASQWMNHFASTEQLWQLPGPPTSTPPTNYAVNSTYSPSTYGYMPGARPAVDTTHKPTFLQRRPSNSIREDDIGQHHVNGSNHVAKPPLPVSNFLASSWKSNNLCLEFLSNLLRSLDLKAPFSEKETNTVRSKKRLIHQQPPHRNSCRP